MAKEMRSVAAVYFDRFNHRESELNCPVPSNLELIVVIPCHNEPDLLGSLQSLKNAVVPIDILVEVITVVNHEIDADSDILKQNGTTVIQANRFSSENNSESITFKTLEIFDMPPKKAGVGLARKIGMDEALNRFSKINKDGIIVCFDADSLCESTYFEAILSHFKKYPKTPGCSIHFEHPLEGDNHTIQEYNAIILYELHLRYYKNAQQYTGLPFVFHTIGSSMAVRAEAYAKQGGMNKRKAGEDFYFLNKIIQLGNFTELNDTTVIPSPRVSDRVPFGTGKAVGEIVSAEQGGLETYSFRIFVELKGFVSEVYENNKNLNASKLSGLINQFIEDMDLGLKIDEIAKNANSEEAFITRFFKVFDAFWIMKYVHFARDNFHKQVSVLAASNELLLELGVIDQPLKTELEALIKFRILDKNRDVK
jgi:glycosyltransferase involved in cell wall biosynthesis